MATSGITWGSNYIDTSVSMSGITNTSIATTTGSISTTGKYETKMVFKIEFGTGTIGGDVFCRILPQHNESANFVTSGSSHWAQACPNPTVSTTRYVFINVPSWYTEAFKAEIFNDSDVPITGSIQYKQTTITTA